VPDASLDFAVAPPGPRNSDAANTRVCACTANETGAAREVDFCNLQHPPSTSTPAGTPTESIYARIFEAGATEPAGANASIQAQLGVGPAGVNPQNQAGFTWVDAAWNVQIGNDDEYQATLTPLAPGSYRYTSRFSFDGVNWTYCDLDGAGSNAGLAFDPAGLGVLTVSP
jgi:hypothetical protein